MRKVIMGVGTFLVVIGLLQLILSVALIGGVRAQVDEIDPLIEDAAGTLTEVADAADRGGDFLAELDPDLAKLEGTIADTIDDSVRQLGDIDANLAEAEVEVPGGIDGVVSFLDNLDSVLAEVERPVGLMDDTVTFLDDLDADMAVVEGEVAATLEATIDYLRRLDAAMVEADGVATLTIDDTLEYLRQFGATLALVDETVTGITDNVILTRDHTVERLEQLVVEIRAGDIEQLIAPADGVLADAEKTVADMTTGVIDAREATREELELIAAEEVGIWSGDLIGWAYWIEDTLALWDIDVDIAYLRDLAYFIEPGWMLFPLEVSPDDLDRLAELVEDTELAARLRAEAEWLRQEGFYLTITPEEVVAEFDRAIEPLERVSTAIADASAWLTFWPDFVEDLERADIPLMLFPLEMTAEDVDLLADHVEDAGLDAAWLRAQADWLRQRGVMWSLTPHDFALAFDPVIEGLEEALSGIAYTSEYLGTLQTRLAVFRKLAVDNIARTRDFVGEARTSIDEIDQRTLDRIAAARELLREARTRIAEAKEPMADGLAESRASIQGVEGNVERARDPVIDGIASTRELLGTAKTSLEDIRTPALDGIADTREYILTAQADIGALGEDLRVISGDIVGLGIGGMIGGMIGWLQWFMILMSILFMAAGVGLFLLGMKKAES